jgi:hypothetical protein
MSELQPLIDAVPDDLVIRTEGERHSITIPVAASDDGLKWVAIEVRLWGGHWCGHAVHEFKFAIIYLDDEDGQPVEIFDRYMAAGYLESVRPLVMPCVCAGARELVRKVQPNVIYRGTYTTRPSEKALGKHHMITDTIAKEGYEVIQEGTDSQARHYWIMAPTGDA